MSELKRSDSEVLFWPHTCDPNVASFRIRCNMVFNALQQRGVAVRIIDADNLQSIKGKISVLVLSKRLDLDSLTQALEFKRLHGTRLILDICDSIFPVKDKDGKQLQNKIQFNPREYEARIKAMKGFDHIVTPSQFLTDLYQEHIGEGPQYSVIADIAEKFAEIDYSTQRQFAKNHLLAWNLNRKITRSSVEKGRRLLWYGVDGSNWGNGMADLPMLFDALHEHDGHKKLSLSVVSNNKHTYRKLFRDVTFDTHYLKWHYSTIGKVAAMHDIVLIPVQKNSFSLGKSANRITTAFNNNLAVAATHIPSYKHFEGVAVFDDWGEGLGHLMANSTERMNQVVRAKKVIEDKYDIVLIAQKWVKLLNSLEN